MNNHTTNTNRYLQDIQQLRYKFYQLDHKDPQQLKRWFDEYSYLSTNDHAQIANKSAYYIRKLKKLAGIKSKMPANIPPPNIRNSINTINVPDNWDDPEWLSKAINIYSIKSLAAACHVTRNTIRKRINQYQLKIIPKPISKNKCCTWNWCNKHYTELGWSQAKCAQKAGISQQAFANWLNHYKIPVRTKRETIKSHNQVQLWVRKLFDQLTKQPIVNKVFLRSDHIHVRFKNYFWETYYVQEWPANKRRPKLSYIIDSQQALIENVPQVLSEYENESFEDVYDKNGIIQKPHIIINRDQFEQASLLEQRLALHEFCRQITQRGWIWPEHPEHILQAEYEKMLQFKESKYIVNGIFSIFANNGMKPAPGRRIIEHFFDISEFADVFRSPRLVMKILNELASRSDLKLNTHNMLRIFSCGEGRLPGNHRLFRMFDPVAYSVIFKRLGINGSILDISPGYGNRAIAAAINQLKYYTMPDDRFNKALSKGFAEFCGLDYTPWEQNQVDLLIYDNNFDTPNMSVINDYMSFAKRMIIFVPNRLKVEYQAKYKPESVIKLKTKWFQRSPDYLFLW
jgi:transcriptional regulator with XRE-family HTH domain